MAKQLVAGVLGRLKESARAFVEAQRDARRRNDQLSLIGRAVVKLGTGWSESSLKTAMGLKAPRKPDQLPHSSALLRFCAVADVSSEWLFAGVGPRNRSALRAGGTLTTAALARELSAHVIAACAPVYGQAKWLECDADELLADLTGRAVEDARLDHAEFHDWERRQMHLAKLLEALSVDGGDSDRAERVETLVMEGTYLLHSQMRSDHRPARRIASVRQRVSSSE